METTLTVSVPWTRRWTLAKNRYDRLELIDPRLLAARIAAEYQLSAIWTGALLRARSLRPKRAGPAAKTRRSGCAGARGHE